jgi:cysteine desulfurase
MQTVYLDHAATTALDSRVLDTMIPWLKDEFGNASSIHTLGRAANVAVEEAREQISHYLHCTPAEVIFTSGGTESDNTAILGTLEASTRNEFITSNAEHHAVLNHAEHVIGKYKSQILPVNKKAQIELDQLKQAISTETALVSLMHVNNENGAINPIKQLAEITHQHGAYFHTDAVQSAGKFDLNVDELGVDYLSISGHKLYGPKGIGVLYVRAGSEFKPFMLGGSQERRRRAGTLNVPGIVGLGKAIALAVSEMNPRKAHISGLKTYLENGLQQVFGANIQFNNPIEQDSYHIVNFSFLSKNNSYLDGEMLLLNLDIEGIYCSNGSACTSGAVEPSHVLLAMGIDSKIAKSSLRLSLGKDNTKEQLDYVIEKLEKITKRMGLR